MRPDSADVAVIGAGLVGTSIAWRLAKAGVPVSLYDLGSLGGEASSAGAGMLSPGGEFDKPSVWLDLGIESMRMYPAFIEQLRSETGLPIDFALCGCVQFCGCRGEAQRRAEFQSAVGIRVEVTPRGLFYPEDGFVDPTGLLRALRRACEARKVGIFERHPITEIETNDYRAVVIAAGAWSGQIRVTHGGRPVALPATTPIKGHLIGFDLDPGTLGPMVRQGHTYVLQRSNGFTIAGSTEETVGFDRTVDEGICADIHRRAAHLFPALGSAKPSKRWIGFGLLSGRPAHRTGRGCQPVASVRPLQERNPVGSRDSRPSGEGLPMIRTLAALPFPPTERSRAAVLLFPRNAARLR